MTQTRLRARLEVTNGGGTFDSLNPRPRLGDTLDEVRIAASVTKTLDPTPNRASIRIWNLSQETIDRITGTVRRRIEWTPTEKLALVALGADASPIETIYDNYGLGSIRLSWGYEGADAGTPFPPLSVGFIGESTKMVTDNDGLDNVLEIHAEDGGQLLGAGRLQKSYKPGANTADILADLVGALGLTVDRDKLELAMQSALLARGIPVGKIQQLGGYNAGGKPAADLIRAITKGLELRWSIQDGEFLLLDSNTVLAGYEPIVLSSERATLLGKPEPLDDLALKAETWAAAEARPGRQVLVKSALVDAQYRIDKVTTTLDTYEGGRSELTLDAIQTIPGVF